MKTDSTYIHGTEPEEQERLSLLNGLLNAASLRASRLRAGERVLDLGCGLGQLSRAMAREVGPDGEVVGVERDESQIEAARRLAAQEGEEGLVEFRFGSVAEPPLAATDWGSFDVAHARFVLEHLDDPEAAVELLVRAVRPGGRIVLEDDDHDLLRLWPAAPEFEALWQEYARTYEHLGNDPWIGRRLVGLLEGAGAKPRRTDMLFFGACAGSAVFDAMIDNFAGVVRSARDAIVELGGLGAVGVDSGLAALERWRQHPQATLWYSTCWAEAMRPEGRDESTVGAPSGSSLMPRSEVREELRLRGDRRISPLRFLAESAQDLSSTLELDEVFQRLARRIQDLLDAHLLCIMLWSEERQLLEHSFSLKFGQHVPQRGGFPLGYGLSGTAAKELRPVRVANVIEDERYVRFRHAEVEIRSELAVPLINDGRLVGVLDLESTELDAFTLEHEQVVSALASHVAAAMENARLYEEVRSRERRFDEEMETARRIQRGLLPKALPHPPGLEIGASLLPARELSGDFYDFFGSEDGGFGFALGDVAGKGTGAALLASVAVGAFRGQALRRWNRPKDILRDLNDQLRELELEHRFVALLCGIYERSEVRLRLSNAGLPAPLRYRGGEVEPIDLSGLPLGGLANQRYPEAVIEIGPGDLLVFSSDGIEEASNAAGEIFGVEGITKVVRGDRQLDAQGYADAIVAAAEAHAGASARLVDDRTVIVLRAP